MTDEPSPETEDPIQLHLDLVTAYGQLIVRDLQRLGIWLSVGVFATALVEWAIPAVFGGARPPTLVVRLVLVLRAVAIVCSVILGGFLVSYVVRRRTARARLEYFRGRDEA